MMKRGFLFLVAVFILTGINTFAQTYKIDVKINDLKNEKIFLGYYYGDKTYVRDTALLDNNGKGTFKGDSLLDEGMYIIVMPSKNYFDILIDKDQEFYIETSTDNFLSNLKIKGSDVNTVFKNFQDYMGGLNKKSQEIQEKLKKLDKDSDSTKMLQEQINGLSKEVELYWDKVIAENKGNMLSVIINAMRNPEIPEIEVPENVKNKDSVRWFFSYNYNREHYFENIDLSDKRFLRTPIFHKKLETFFTKVLIQHPDSIDSNVDILLKKTGNSDEMFQYIVRYVLNTFLQSNIMGMDKVFVYVAENYYLSGKVDWMDEENLQKIKDRVAKLRFNLIGNTAQNLKMETIHNQYEQLNDIKAKFILVYFWEPNCGHCKKVTPEVHKLYQEFDRSEFEVFAVYTQGDKEEWTKYVNEKGYDDWINVWDPYNLTNFRMFYDIYSTPTIYLLDKDKKIIAKRVSHETLRNILEIELGKRNIGEEIKEEHE